MELREIISFYHVARLRSVSKAARKLELGQPTVTTHLRKLEGEFGIILFDRIKRPIQLTSEGTLFYELVTPIVESIDTLKTQMDYTEGSGFFRGRRLPRHRVLSSTQADSTFPQPIPGCENASGRPVLR